MMKQLMDRLRRFTHDRSGNVAVIMVLSASVLITAIGGGLDFSRSTAVSTELQSALDSGVLAAASLSQDRSPEAVVRAYVQAALEDKPAVLSSLSVNVTADISLNSRQVTASASVEVPTTMLGMVGMTTIPVSAQSEAIEQVRDVEISLVLDISGSMNGSKINAMRDAAEEFVEVVLAADDANRTSISIIPYNGGVRTPAVVNERLIDHNNRNQRNRSGCLELAIDEDDEILRVDPGNQRAVISPDLPTRYFDWVSFRGQDQYNNRNSSQCPESNEASMFLSDDQDDLLSLIDRLDAGGYTGLDVATAWGARALDPAWRGRLGGDFSDRPAGYDDRDTIKILVVMTDGAATAQYRSYRNNNNNWRTYQPYNSGQARRNMAEACDTAEARGVQIYTIAFQLSGNTNRNLMRNCANKPQNYYQVENLDIDEAFSAIAADINQLRLTR